MRQRRWLELLKDYNANTQYHLDKANVVADALSRSNLKIQLEIIKDLEFMEVELVVRGSEEDRQAEFWVDDHGVIWDVYNNLSEVGELVIEGPETVKVMNKNKVVIAKKKLKEARSRKKSYVDRHQRALEFKTEDSVFLKVSPCKGVRRCDLKGKLSPRFICPFEILDRVGEVSYHLALLPQLSHVHNVFHISLLRGYNYHPLHVISYSLDMISGKFIFC
nr:putative reverse transcriptase domain-containing protein [Tanacetum cinerariifolium]